MEDTMHRELTVKQNVSYASLLQNGSLHSSELVNEVLRLLDVYHSYYPL